MVIEVSHPSFPADFAIRAVVRAGESKDDAAKRAYHRLKMEMAFSDYRPATGNRFCVQD